MLPLLCWVQAVVWCCVLLAAGLWCVPPFLYVCTAWQCGLCLLPVCHRAMNNLHDAMLGQAVGPSPGKDVLGCSSCGACKPTCPGGAYAVAGSPGRCVLCCACIQCHCALGCGGSADVGLGAWVGWWYKHRCTQQRGRCTQQ
jgi:hypothetical protein